MNEKLIDIITNVFFVVLTVLALIITVRLVTMPTTNRYKVYNDKNNYVVIEESR